MAIFQSVMFVFMLDADKPENVTENEDTDDNENIPNDETRNDDAIDINEEKSSYDQPDDDEPDDDEPDDDSSGAEPAVDNSEKSCEDEMKHGCSTLRSRGFCKRFSVIRDKHCRKTCKTCLGN